MAFLTLFMWIHKEENWLSAHRNEKKEKYLRSKENEKKYGEQRASQFKKKTTK